MWEKHMAKPQYPQWIKQVERRHLTKRLVAWQSHSITEGRFCNVKTVCVNRQMYTNIRQTLACNGIIMSLRT